MPNCMSPNINSYTILMMLWLQSLIMQLGTLCLRASFSYASNVQSICYLTSMTDIDECLVGTAECDNDANCTNTIGGYNCSCNSGYEGDGSEGNCSSESMFL